MEPKKKVQVAFIDEPTVGIGPNGRGAEVEPGAYKVAELDGMRNGVVMIEGEDGALLAMVAENDVAEVLKVLDGPYPVAWAVYHRAHPNVLASWAEQNGRKP
jgi:hypothetical protein